MPDIRIYDWIAPHARSHPDKPALVDDYSSRSFTYADLDRRIEALAGALRAQYDLAAGDSVVTLAHNSTNIIEVQFACQRIGAIFVPLNVRLASDELKDILEDCGAKILLYDTDFSETATQVAQAKDDLRLMSMNEHGGPCEYESAIAEGISLGTPYENMQGDTWTLIYTSGTTGMPKGVMISYRMVLFHALNYGFETGVASDSHGLTFLPMFHTSGLNLAANPCLLAGGCVTVMRRFDPRRALQLLTHSTHVFGVPANYLFMQQLPEFVAADLSSIRSIGVGGAPMPIALLQAYAEKGAGMQQTFGMTETGPTVTILSTHRAFDKQGSAGLPVAQMEVRVADERGEVVPQGEIGELWVRGPSITQGYWNRPEETRKSFVDGWFRTGDMVRQDDDGYFYVVDRCKNMYISGGENVYPAEVERAIEKMQGVQEVVVIAIPDDKWGEVGHAVVVPVYTDAVCIHDILEHCRHHIAGYKVPKSVTFLPALPRNATGKVDRRAVAGAVAKAAGVNER
ncbi:long-chain fatty acid--CoA ligase [Alcaligenaceae bacterium]|nr:long-chain fatty acid--CoA ligase [Alcaligenaceae bacterium]